MLQYAQNSLSRVVHHSSSSSRRLTFISSRIRFKMVFITYKTLSTDQPPYLKNLLNPYRPSRSLRSANCNLLLIPPHNTNFSSCAFSFAAPIGIQHTTHIQTPSKNTIHISSDLTNAHTLARTATAAPQIRRSTRLCARYKLLYCIVL